MPTSWGDRRGSGQQRVHGGRRLGWWGRGLLVGASVLAAASAMAAGPTHVSGAIATDTTWTLSESPYVLTGEVTVTGRKVLTIEPGVRVLMQTGASLAIVDGGLSAQGTAAQPVVFTSTKEDGATAAPGDWQTLRFEDGTLDERSVLSHVQIRYGSGLVIHSAAPTLDDVSIDHHAAPAISLDLGSSPKGKGLSATGNLLNGILVPAGVITRDTAWRLKGIPYVVSEGTIAIGLPPFSFTPSALQLTVGQVGHLTLNLPSVAPAGGVTVAVQGTSSNVQFGSSLVIPEGAHSGDVVLTAVAQGTTTITATADDFGSATASITVVPRPALTLSPATLTIGADRKGTMSVRMPAPASEAVLVGLSATPGSIVQIPANVTIERGATATSFDVQGSGVGVATLRAEADGFTQSSASVTVRPLMLSAPGTAFVAPDLTTDLIVTLSDPAPAEGLTLTIDKGGANFLDVPSSVPVAAGETSVRVPLAGIRDNATAATLTFGASGYQSASTKVTVRRIVASLGTGVQQRTMAQGSKVTLPVSLSVPAPAGGVTLELTTATDGIVDVQPNQVFVPEGHTAATASASLEAVARGQSAVVLAATAATPGIDGLYGVTVTEQPTLRFAYERIELGRSLSHPVDIVCSADDIACDFDRPITIALTSSDPGKVSIPSTVTLAPHTNRIGFNLVGLDVTAASVSIHAQSQIPEVGSSTKALEVRVSQPKLYFDHLGEEEWEDPQVAGRARKPFHVCWHAGYSSIDTTVRLQVVDATSPTLIDGIYDSPTGSSPLAQFLIPEGESCAELYAGVASEPGSYRVRATVDGLGQWTSGIQAVVKPVLEFSDSLTSLGEGLAVDSLHIRSTPGYACTEYPSISIVSSDPDKLEVTYVYPDSYCDAWFGLRGKAVTDAPVSIIASEPNGDPVAMSVSVVPKRVAFSDLDGVRSLTSGRDEFVVVWEGEHSPWLDEDKTIALSVVDETPTGVLPVPSLRDQDDNGLSSVTLRAHGGSGYARIAPPNLHGSYRLSAELDGQQIGLSERQVVGRGLVRWYPESWSTDANGALIVGKGLQQWATLRFFRDGGRRWDEWGPPDGNLTVRLVSRAPDWVQVPESVTFEANGTGEVRVPIVGIDLTTLPIAIDAYVGDDAEPFSLDVRVHEPQLRFGMDPVRAVNGAPAPLSLYWVVPYPCERPEDSDEPEEPCTTDAQAPVQTQSFQLAIVEAGAPPIVGGFHDDAGPVATVEQLAGDEYSQSVTVDSPNAAGSYRVRATLGPGQEWLSEPVTVDKPQLTIANDLHEAPMDEAVVGRGLRLTARLGVTIADQPMVFANDVSVQVSCTDPSVCTTDATILIPANESSATFGIVGSGIGRTDIQASAPGLHAAVPFAAKVVAPTLGASGPSMPIIRGTQHAFDVFVYVENAGDQTQVAASDLSVDVASALPSVADVQPATVTIPAGSSRSGTVQLDALRTGRTAISVRGAYMRPYTSEPITVTGN